MQTPGSDHPITFADADTRWRVRYAGHVIADTDRAILLKEADYPQVVYFPKEDVEMAYFGRSDHHTACPYKGEASYWTLTMEGNVEDNVAWSYESPYPSASRISGHVAFYPDRVEVYEVSDAAVNPKHLEERSVDRREIDEIVQHTDSGSGLTQREHWAPNVEGPGPEGGVR